MGAHLVRVYRIFKIFFFFFQSDSLPVSSSKLGSLLEAMSDVPSKAMLPKSALVQPAPVQEKKRKSSSMEAPSKRARTSTSSSSGGTVAMSKLCLRI